jgi:hypothetical protein
VHFIICIYAFWVCLLSVRFKRAFLACVFASLLPALRFVDGETLFVVGPIRFGNVESLFDVFALEIRSGVAVGSRVSGRGVPRLRVAAFVVDVPTITAVIMVHGLGVAVTPLMGGPVTPIVMMNWCQ